MNEAKTSTGLQSLSADLADLVEAHAPRVVELVGARVPASATIWGPAAGAETLAVTVAHAMGRNNEGKVRLHDGTEVAAKVLGRDPSYDLALLKIELPDDYALPEAPAGEAAPRIGELVVVLGALRRRTVANLGMVSSVGAGWRTRLGAELEQYLEVDAELPRGSSGGPLVAADGKLVGINTHGLVRGGTTIPAADVQKAVERLERGGDRQPGFLGVRFSPARINDHGERERALLVTAVGDDSPAAKADIKVGDLILNVEGQPVRRGDDLLAALATRANEATAIELWRGGQSVQVSAVPVPRRWGRPGGHHKGRPAPRKGPPHAGRGTHPGDN